MKETFWCRSYYKWKMVFYHQKRGRLETFNVTPMCLTFTGASLSATFLSVVNTLHSSSLFLLSAGLSSPPHPQHLQTAVSLCKSPMCSGPGKSCLTLTQWPPACFNVPPSSHPHFDGIHPPPPSVPSLVSPCGRMLPLLFCASVPILFVWQLCNVELTGNTHGNGALRCHIWAGKRERENKAEKVTRVASCSPDECQETHICLSSMGTGSWSSTCTENPFQTSSLNKEEPYEVLQRQISGWVSQSRTYCQPPTYGGHMHTRSIKGSPPPYHYNSYKIFE